METSHAPSTCSPTGASSPRLYAPPSQPASRAAAERDVTAKPMRARAVLAQKRSRALARAGLTRKTIGDATRRRALFSEPRIGKALVELDEQRPRQRRIVVSERALYPAQQRQLGVEWVLHRPPWCPSGRGGGHVCTARLGRCLAGRGGCCRDAGDGLARSRRCRARWRAGAAMRALSPLRVRARNPRRRQRANFPPLAGSGAAAQGRLNSRRASLVSTSTTGKSSPNITKRVHTATPAEIAPSPHVCQV